MSLPRSASQDFLNPAKVRSYWENYKSKAEDFGRVSGSGPFSHSYEDPIFKNTSGSSHPQTKGEEFPVTNCPQAESKDELMNKFGLWSWGDIDMKHPIFSKIDAAEFFEVYKHVGEKCIICGGAHSHSGCGLKYSCPLNQLVGDDFVVLCTCTNIVIDGKCPMNCGSTWGRATYKHSLFGNKHNPSKDNRDNKSEGKDFGPGVLTRPFFQSNTNLGTLVTRPLPTMAPRANPVSNYDH